MSTSTLADIQTVYTYGTTGYDINSLIKVETGANSINYTYDKYGRTATEKRLIEGAGQVDFVFGYNADGQLQTTTYTGGVKVEREYDSYGNPVKIISQGQTVWELTGAEGKKTTTRLGGTMTATTTLDAQGQLQNQATVKAGIPNIRDFGYSFNAITGNLNHRINGLTGLKETFAYDALDRLTSVKEGTSEVEVMAMQYNANGNISSKTGLGAYGYEPVRVHAVSRVDYNPQMMPSTIQEITYNALNKAACLKDTIDTNAYQLDISYGPDQQRWKSVLKKNGSDIKTIIFAHDYEKFIDNGVTRELYYIGASDGLAAIYVKPEIGAASMYYAHTDHLGSIVSLTDSAGVAVFKASYDAWGKQTVSLNTIGFYRGYTGHEHLPEFGLINMNGRMYDPVLGRFLSPDNYVQAADFSQSFNRYSYCWNNPLIYTDPDGEVVFTILAAIFCQPLLPFAIAADINAISNVVSNWGEIDNFWKGAGAYVAGGINGVLSSYGPLGSFGGGFTENLLNGLIFDHTKDLFNKSIIVGGTNALNSKISSTISKYSGKQLSKLGLDNKLLKNILSETAGAIPAIMVSEMAKSKFVDEKSNYESFKDGISGKTILSGLFSGIGSGVAKSLTVSQRAKRIDRIRQNPDINDGFYDFRFNKPSFNPSPLPINPIINPIIDPYIGPIINPLNLPNLN